MSSSCSGSRFSIFLMRFWCRYLGGWWWEGWDRRGEECGMEGVSWVGVVRGVVGAYGGMK